MYDYGTECKFKRWQSTNINSLINCIYSVVQYKKLEITKDDIKEYFRNLHAMDFHIFFTMKMRTEYWSKICYRVMKVYQKYFNDAMAHFGLVDVLMGEEDLNAAMFTMFNIRKPRDTKECDYGLVYDHDYLMKYVPVGNNDYFFDIYAAIAADSLHTFMPNIYGGKRIRPFTTVENAAHVPFVMTDKVSICLNELWNWNTKETKNFIIETMKYYFHEDSIKNLLRYIKDHKKAPYGYNVNNIIIFNNLDNILYNTKYTLTEPRSKIDSYKEYFKWYIDHSYKTMQDIPCTTYQNETL